MTEKTILTMNFQDAYRTYRKACDAVAKEAFDESYNNEERALELIDEMVDDHQFIIYNVFARRVLTLSDNLSAFEEEGGEVDGQECSELDTQRAYYAMRTDVLKSYYLLQE